MLPQNARAIVVACENGSTITGNLGTGPFRTPGR